MTHPEKLENADWLADTDLQTILALLSTDAAPARVNGGAVRNAVLGMPIADVDISTIMLPEQVMEHLQAEGIKVIPTGIDHGTVTAVSNHRGYEITTLREDVSTDGRRAVVKFGTDWAKDALRRDLTMNALYCDRHGNILDPLGGYNDLVARRVRFIGKAEDRLQEDFLRILRFFRFFAWYGEFRPDAEGLKACAKHKEKIKSLSAERVWAELKKLMSAPDPRRAVLWMRTTGILSVTLPESDKWGIDAIHPLVECEAEYGWEVDPLLRLCAIIPQSETNVVSLAKRLKLSKEERQIMLAWAQCALPSLNGDEIQLGKQLYYGIQEGMLYALKLEITRLKGAGDQQDGLIKRLQQLDRVEKWARPNFPVGGKDLTSHGIAPGPAMGEKLGQLELRWVESGFSLTREQLLDQI